MHRPTLNHPSVTLLAEPLVLDPSSSGCERGPAGPPRGAARGLAQPARRAGPPSGHVPRLGGCKGVPRAVRLGLQVSGRSVVLQNTRFQHSRAGAAFWFEQLEVIRSAAEQGTREAGPRLPRLLQGSRQRASSQKNDVESRPAESRSDETSAAGRGGADQREASGWWREGGRVMDDG
ncbi:hypothetical protein BBK36DRAFT_1182175 [Trichoderma citrinoviride]|uniref:Uncharacterized protein n=1 Tax=Trichoderma citrinoviride TaxID=58853 RepID=A0A2T4B2J0_9HYPO|nr:hypothetical protein BBK36DRAFT_1182175 [Trichoderma citrinoviride]PTB63520.1 hypothetical protein BBK36DRAFT_1182175 [Trichoderma citrinoviride]